jgi:hypothetical protein
MSPERVRAEEYSQHFIAAAAQFAAEWCKDQVGRAIIAKPDITMNFGAERLGPLKVKLQSLLEQMPEVTGNQLNEDRHWLHRGEIPEAKDDWRAGPYRVQGSRPPDDLDKGIRQIFGHAGALLVEYGFDERGDIQACPVPCANYSTSDITFRSRRHFAWQIGQTASPHSSKSIGMPLTG